MTTFEAEALAHKDDVLKQVELSGKKKNCESQLATVIKELNAQEKVCK